MYDQHEAIPTKRNEESDGTWWARYDGRPWGFKIDHAREHDIRGYYSSSIMCCSGTIEKGRGIDAFIPEYGCISRNSLRKESEFYLQ